jgi:class I fructose-bisphosphate aldolase
MIETIRKHLADKASLLDYQCQGIPKAMLHLPGPDFVDRVVAPSDRPINVLRSLSWLFNTGRLAGTGYVSILPVDQGIEHSGAASFAPNPAYFDPENLVKLALEGGCNAVASTLGALGSTGRCPGGPRPWSGAAGSARSPSPSCASRARQTPTSTTRRRTP